MAKQEAKTAAPRLRFPEFHGEAWALESLNSHLEECGYKVESTTSIPIYSSSRVGLKPQSDYYDGQTLLNDGGYGVVPPDAFVYRHMSDDGRFAFNINETGSEIAVSKEYPVFRTVDLNAKFLLALLNNSPAFKAFALSQKAGGTRTRLYFSRLREWRTSLPTLSEQQKIADCLTSLDELIAVQGHKVEALKAHKRGLMQQLFPREGETVPRLRFPEFRDALAWRFSLLRDLEEKNLVELGRGNVISHDDMRADPGPNPVYSSSVINQGLMGTYGRYMFDEELISWSVDGGGHFFHRPKHKFSVTNVSGFMRVLDSNVVCKFLAYQLQKLHEAHTFDYQQKAHPSVIRMLYSVGIPDSKEQQRIVDCLSSLDTRITAETHQLAALKTHKQGLMQQLFPAPQVINA